MPTSAVTELVYDPHDRVVAYEPWEVFRRLRDEAPLYHNPDVGFYAVSRHEDVERTYLDKTTFSSARGTTIGLIQSGHQLPPGTVLFEDPPAHTVHRKLLSRMFTPRRVAELEVKTREMVTGLFDGLAGLDRFDFVDRVAKPVPTRVISMLVGIPEPDQESVRDRFEPSRGSADRDLDALFSGELFTEYVDWRIDHPSDDVMTQLLYAEFEDEFGVVRKLTREELLAYVNIVAMAGNESTRLAIGWTIKLLSDHPDERRRLLDDPSLVANAVEESLRYEPAALQACRHVTRDVEIHGEVVPEGSVMAMVVASANRDERRWERPDDFDVTRRAETHLTFGFGSHYCLGQALARLEIRLVLEEMLRRFPEWNVDMSAAELRKGDVEMRGFEVLPVDVG
jgi:cytochrome P450